MTNKRLSNAIRAQADAGQKAFGAFVTCGYPSPAATVDILAALERGGADFLELGMPFSDPLAEGPAIQQASEAALAAGTTLAGVIQTVRQFRKRSDLPLLLMGYTNPILAYGVASFQADAIEAGVDGLILADLPIDQEPMFFDGHATMTMVRLVAPTTPSNRIKYIDSVSDSFVYAVSVTGLTGSSIAGRRATAKYLKAVNSCVDRNPIMVGFGIDSYEAARKLSKHTDGFIVGSALIRRIDALWSNPSYDAVRRLDELAEFTASLKYGARGLAAARGNRAPDDAFEAS